MSILFRPREMFAHETPPQPPQNTSGSAEVSEQEPAGSGGQSRVLSADDFDRFQQSVNERFDQIGQRVDGFGQQITEGFGWVRENLAPANPAAEGEPDSQLANLAETTIEVQDRPPVRGKKPRKRLNLSKLFQ